MFKVIKKEIEVAGKKISLETGKIARQADGAIIAQCGETVVLATAVGASVPLLLKKLDFDPAISTGPFVTTAIDILGVALYFLIASLTIIIHFVSCEYALKLFLKKFLDNWSSSITRATHSSARSILLS